MSDYILYGGELYHYGVKGMKWGHRKYQAKAQALDQKRVAYKQAKRSSNKAFAKANAKAMLAFSPSKKHRQAAVDNWKKAFNSDSKVRTAKKKYKEAKKEFRKNTTVGQKIGRALSLNGAKAATKAVAKVGSLYAADKMFNNGRGTEAVKTIVNTIGRTAVSAFARANGATNIRWS